MGSVVLKTVALLSMVCDHVGIVIGNDVLRAIGRMAFILFAFSCAEGYRLTHDKDRYLCRLMVWAGVSQLPYMLFKGFMPVFWVNGAALCAGVILAIWFFWAFSDTSYMSGHTGRLLLLIASFLLPMVLYQNVPGGVPVPAGLNVLYTMSAACTGMALMDKDREGSQPFFVFLLMVVFCGLYCDYSVFGIALIMLFYAAEPKGKGRRFLVAVLWSFVVYMLGSDSPAEFIGALAGSMLVLAYDRSKGTCPKWYGSMFYWFYPAHMLVLWFLSCAELL